MALPPITITAPQGEAITSTGSGTLALELGQQLVAKVVKPTGSNSFELQAGRQRLNAQTSLPLKTGDTLVLQVTGRHAGQQPVLTIRQSSNPQVAVNQALRESLPQQKPIQPLLEQIARLPAAEQLPKPLQKATDALLRNSLALKPGIQPDEVRKAIENSGLFMENKLARQKTQQLPQDFKANLSRLLQTGQQLVKQSVAPEHNQPAPAAAATQATAPTPAEPVQHPLARTAEVKAQALTDNIAKAVQQTNIRAEAQVPTTPETPAASKVEHRAATLSPAHTAATEKHGDHQPLNPDNLLQIISKASGALHKLQSQQLSHLQNLQEGQPNWHLSIPLTMDGRPTLLELRIQKEATSSHAGKPETDSDSWRFQLQLDLESLGPMQVNLHLKGNHLNTHFVVQETRTQALLQQHRQQLIDALAARELQIENFSAVVCTAGPTESPITTGHNLVSEKI